jgi:murein DD-endopeptidase MepM/ murein hydrolase activator NlpD
MHQKLALIIKKYRSQFNSVVPFVPGRDKIVALDLSSSNTALDKEVYQDTDGFTNYIQTTLEQAGALYGIGGYLEKRNLYKRSALFETLKQSKKTFDRIYIAASEPDEPVIDESMQRSIHLGIDIWGPAGTPVYAALGGSVHSFAFNEQFGDYGATIILQHQLDGLYFHTLYGHLSKSDLAIQENGYIAVGETIGHFGAPEENGHWPPHLHFQIIVDMELKEGDYPGVCHPDDLPYYSKNCPDPDLILDLNKWANQQPNNQ